MGGNQEHKFLGACVAEITKADLVLVSVQDHRKFEEIFSGAMETRRDYITLNGSLFEIHQRRQPRCGVAQGYKFNSFGKMALEIP